MPKYDKYKKAYQKKLEASEKKILPKIYRFYKQEYNKGVENFILTNNTNYQSLFQYDYVKRFYTELYKSIGVDMYKWYLKNYKKYIKKEDPFSEDLNIWKNIFSDYANQVAATNVVLVSGTAQKTLIKITQRILSDPELSMLGADEKARILRNQFNKYSKVQALRLVRTESNRIANYATQQTALTVFGPENLQKTWLHSGGANERPTHVALDGVTIPYKEPFNVGGEPMQRPGEGSAENIINCRCTINYEPAELPDADILRAIGVVI